MSDGADKQNGAEATGRPQRPQPQPPGYFEGESMTRRRAFTVAVQGIGGVAGAAIVLPVLGVLVYLASTDSDFVTGQTILVDGGSVLY